MFYSSPDHGAPWFDRFLHLLQPPMAPDRGQSIYKRILTEASISLCVIGVGYFAFHYLLKNLNLDPEKEQKERAQIESAAILKRLDGPGTSQDEAEDVRRRNGRSRRPRMAQLHLTQYEQTILRDLVFPEDIPVSFIDIGGLGSIVEELRESVIYPLTMPDLYSHSSSLLAAPSGVLLYGPPGCGKTMICKALAHESGACFINLHISTLTEKWFGDSNKLVNAVFSLARKLQPTIIFIDEIDAVLGTRHSGEHEASGMVKAEFMTMWDGLISADDTGLAQRILVLGATNRINDIDDAILRRMPKKFHVGLPNVSQRLKILKIVLKDTKLDPDIDLPYVARIMEGMSGSDIKEACRDAAMIPVREMIRQQRESGKRMEEMKAQEVRGLKLEDFFAGIVTKKAAKGQAAAATKSDTTSEQNGVSRVHNDEEWESASSTPLEQETTREVDLDMD